MEIHFIGVKVLKGSIHFMHLDKARLPEEINTFARFMIRDAHQGNEIHTNPCVHFRKC